MTLVQITHYSSPNNTNHPQVNMHWIHYIEKFFTVSRFLSNLRLLWKTEFALKYFTVLSILCTFRIFEQLALALKSCPEIFHCIENFYHSRFLSNLHLPWIHCIEYLFFIIQGFWAICACPENGVCPENFQARGAAIPPPRTPMTTTTVWLNFTQDPSNSWCVSS